MAKRHDDRNFVLAVRESIVSKLTYRYILLIGDVLAVAAFVIVGQYFHNMTVMANAALRAVEQIAAIGLPFILLA